MIEREVFISGITTGSADDAKIDEADGDAK